MESSHAQMVNLIWNIADDVLRDVFVRGQYRDFILPMVVLRRLDALLEPTKDAVDEEFQYQKEHGMKDSGALMDAAGQNFYNTSKWTLARLKSQAHGDEEALANNFLEYVFAYSDNVVDVLKNFDFDAKIRKLAAKKRLLAIIDKITDPYLNLTDKPQTDPDGLIIPALDNIGMGQIFEELLRRFNEENNEEAGEHFTPRDVIALLCRLVFPQDLAELPKMVMMYDPACGSGGMLTEGRDYLIENGIDPTAIQVSGTEINGETYAICKSDLIIKGVEVDGIRLKNTLTDNPADGLHFGYMITNPPYGKSWEEDKKKMYDGKVLLDDRFILPLTNFAGEQEKVASVPRTSDGQLLFMVELIDKMKTLELQPQGSRAVSIHNGSSLFTGDAGGGESNIRRYMVENDYVEAIIQLPNNIFYNTGITTYCWVLTNLKAPERRGKVQLIDASRCFEPLRKNLGNRNCSVTPAMRDIILKAYRDFAECEATDQSPVSSKIFDNDDFRYFSVPILRPLRLRSQMNRSLAESILFDKSLTEVSQMIYEEYGDEVFSGLTDRLKDIRQMLQDREIALTNKQIDSVTSTDKWLQRRLLSEAALQLFEQMGDAVYMDFGKFFADMQSAAKTLGLKLAKTELNVIARTMSVTDPEAAPVIDKKVKAKSKDISELLETYGIAAEDLADYGYYRQGNEYIRYESDTALSDKEQVPVKEDIRAYFLREVRPYVADAWIELPKTQIGCEISFNKYFYRPVQLRSLEENTADILALERENDGLLESLFA